MDVQLVGKYGGVAPATLVAEPRSIPSAWGSCKWTALTRAVWGPRRLRRCSNHVMMSIVIDIVTESQFISSSKRPPAYNMLVGLWHRFWSQMEIDRKVAIGNTRRYYRFKLSVRFNGWHLDGIKYAWKVKLLLCLSAGGSELNIVYAFCRLHYVYAIEIPIANYSLLVYSLIILFSKEIIMIYNLYCIQ